MGGKAVADSRWRMVGRAHEFVGSGGLRPQREQRSDNRIVSVFRLAKLIGEHEEFCLIRNISAGGLKAEVFSSKVPGDALAVDFGDGRPQRAEVRWVSDECVGLAFDKKINLVDTLTQLPAPGDRRSRRLRLLLEVQAHVLLNRQRRQCQLIDVSQGGAKLRTGLKLWMGDRLRLEIPGLGVLSGTVRWVRDGHAGIAFTMPLSYRALARWVAVPAAANPAGPILK